MAERPIEEVIGWTPAHSNRWWRVAFTDLVERATADDLAAWLDGHTDDWGFEDRRPGGPWQVFYFPDDTSVAPDQADEFPSILAALTAAVRKVAGGA